MFLSSLFLAFLCFIISGRSEKIETCNLLKSIEDFALFSKIAGDPDSKDAADYTENALSWLKLKITKQQFSRTVPVTPRVRNSGLWLEKNTDGKVDASVVYTADRSNVPLTPWEKDYLKHNHMPSHSGDCSVDFLGGKDNVVFGDIGKDIEFPEHCHGNLTACMVVLCNCNSEDNKSKSRPAKVYPSGPGAPATAAGMNARMYCSEPQADGQQKFNMLVTSPEDVQRIRSEWNRQPAGTTVLRAKWDVKYEKRTMTNVCGILPGRGVLADEVVLIGSHRDAAGPGAMSQGTGHSVLLELARVLASDAERRSKWKMRRSIMFCSWDGQEIGQLGSKHFVEQYLKIKHRRDKIVSYVNLDTVLAGNYSVRALPSLVYQDFAKMNMKKIRDPRSGANILKDSKRRPAIFPTESIVSRSDDATFLNELNVPTLSYMYDSAWSSRDLYPLHHTLHDTPHLVKLVDPNMELLSTVGNLYLKSVRCIVYSPLAYISPRALITVLPRRKSPKRMKNIRIKYYRVLRMLKKSLKKLSKKKRSLSNCKLARVNNNIHKINKIVAMIYRNIEIMEPFDHQSFSIEFIKRIKVSKFQGYSKIVPETAVGPLIIEKIDNKRRYKRYRSSLSYTAMLRELFKHVYDIIKAGSY